MYTHMLHKQLRIQMIDNKVFYREFPKETEDCSALNYLINIGMQILENKILYNFISNENDWHLVVT